MVIYNIFIINKGDVGYKPLSDEYYLVMSVTPRIFTLKLGDG